MIWVIFVAACSWDNSREAKFIVSTVLQPLYETRGVRSSDIADSCPFKNFERRDLLIPYEAAKIKKTSSSFQCKVCNKTFRSEDYLEKHLLKHSLHDSDRDICPADLCFFIPCPQTSSDVVRARCAAVVTGCFVDKEFALEVVRKLCWDPIATESPWDWGWSLQISGMSLVMVFLVVYYMIVWGEYEESAYKVKTS
jgi:hypothetical protein